MDIRKVLAGVFFLTFLASPAEAVFCRTPEICQDIIFLFSYRLLAPELSCWYGNANFPLLREDDASALAMDIASAYIAGEREDFWAVEVLVFDVRRKEGDAWSEGRNVRPQRFWIEKVSRKSYWEIMENGRLRACTKRERKFAALAIDSAFYLPRNKNGKRR